MKTFEILKKIQILGIKQSPYKKGLTIFLESLAHSLRSGVSIKNAVEETINKNNPEIDLTLKQDLFLLRHQLSLGASLNEALQAWAKIRSNLEVTKTIAVLSFGLENNLGGNKARSIESLAISLRAEIAFEEEIYSLSTQARVSGIVIAVLPVGFLLFFGAVDRQYLIFLFTTIIGFLCLVSGLTLDVLGAFWMRKILRKVC